MMSYEVTIYHNEGATLPQFIEDKMSLINFDQARRAPYLQRTDGKGKYLLHLS